MTQETIKTFETADEAAQYMIDNPGFSGKIHVEEQDGDPEPRDLDDGRDETSYNPDLPVQEDDVTHQVLYLLDAHEADTPARMLSNFDLRQLSADDDLNPSPASSALLKAGYANERKDGRRSFYYMTEEGERLLNRLGDPVDEVTGSNVLDV